MIFFLLEKKILKLNQVCKWSLDVALVSEILTLTKFVQFVTVNIGTRASMLDLNSSDR